MQNNQMNLKIFHTCILILKKILKEKPKNKPNKKKSHQNLLLKTKKILAIQY